LMARHLRWRRTFARLIPTHGFMYASHEFLIKMS
jgi:hypothetical protein